MSQKSRSKRCAEITTALVGAAALAFMLTGCDSHDWENPDYVAQMLEEGTGSQRLKAVDRLGDFSEEERSQLAAAASTAYIEEPALRSDIMQRLIEWRAPEATDAYLKELEGDYAGYARAAGEALGQAGATEAVPQMVELFDQSSNNDVRVGILRGLSHIPEPEAVDQAAEVLSNHDVDNYPITLHQAACNFVGGLAVQDPDAITEDVVSGVVSARFLGDDRGRDTGQECGMAIQQIGPKAVSHLQELFEKENEAVQRILRNYDDPDAGDNFPQNMSRQRAAQHLADLRAPEAEELFLERLQTTIEAPDYEGTRQRAWVVREIGAISTMIRALGDMGSEEALSVFEDLIDDDVYDDGGRWEQIATQAMPLQVVQDVARATNAIGDRDGLSLLLEIVEGGLTEDRLAAYQQHVTVYEEEQEKDEDERRNIPAPQSLDRQFYGDVVALEHYTLLGASEHRSEYEEMLETIEERLEEQEVEGEEFMEKLAGFATAFDVMDECEDVEEESERAGCFAGFLDDEDEHVRAKAAYELSRLSVDAAGPVVAEHLQTEDLETREVLIFAGYRVPTAELVDTIEEVLEAESSRSSSDYEASHQSLEMLQAWLVHNLE